LKREYFITDALAERQVTEADLPLRVGGKEQGGIVIPGVADERLFAFIALSDGHAYIQPAGDNSSLFHNDERLTDSVWLKSGDRVQIGGSVINWLVQGDKVLIDVQGQSEDHFPRPPSAPSVDYQHAGNYELPVHRQDHARSDGKKRHRYFIAFISLLILLVGYLLIATPVVIRTDPQTAAVKMKGFPPVLSLWNSRLALPGQYTIEMTETGYYPLHKPVDIEIGEMLELSYELTELPGLLTIASTPVVPLQLSVDGVKTEITQQGVAEIERGRHKLQITTARYLAEEQELDIQGYGKNQQLAIVLKPAWAELLVTTEPEAAGVYVKGKLLGQTPLKTELLQGSHEIQLKLEGFKTVSIKQIVEAGKNITLNKFELEPVDGVLVLSSVPSAASIVVDGKFSGTTPKKLMLSANAEHSLELSKAGYATAKKSINLKPDEERTIDVALTSEMGTIFLTIRPADATTLLDGKKLEKNQGRLRLAARSHTLTVSKAGYISEKLTIRPRPGTGQNVEINLKTAKQQAAKKKSSTSTDTTSIAGHQLLRIHPQRSFMMGASRREAGRRANESQRLVQLQRPFYFSSKEVTNEDYRRFKKTHDSGNFDGAALNGDEQPVVNISWDDAARYTNWLSKQQGLTPAYVEKDKKMVAVQPMNDGYRLPTEAEWAWVARMQDQKSEQRYPWSGSFPPTEKVGNYADARIADTLADVVPGYDDNFRGSAPVASFQARPKSFYDMGGNVAEWMHDYYAVYPGESAKRVIDPAGAVAGEHHVVRGSSWRHGNITELRLSYRDYSSKPRYDLGFRIARYGK